MMLFFRREREILSWKHVSFWLFSFWYTFKMIFSIEKDAFFEESVKFYVENMYFCDFLASDIPSEWCFSSHQHRINIASTSLCGVQKRPGANFSSVQRQSAVKGNEVESGGGIYRSARIHLAIFVTRRKVRGVCGASKIFRNARIHLALFVTRRKVRGVSVASKIFRCARIHRRAGGTWRILRGSWSPRRKFPAKIRLSLGRTE